MKELSYKNTFFEAVDAEMNSFKGVKNQMELAYNRVELRFKSLNGENKYKHFEVFRSAYARYLRENVISKVHNR